MKHASGLAPVDFLIVGTARTGTTTLFEILRKSPDIFIPPGKECKYFSCTLDDYAGLYAEQVKAYMDNFERVLLMLFERDIVTGRAGNMILDFLKLSRLPEEITSIHINASGYPKSRLLHRLKTRIFADELIGRKIKNLIKKTPFHADSKRLYRNILQTNLERADMKPETRAILADRFRDNVNLLTEYTGLPVYEFWKDFQ